MSKFLTRCFACALLIGFVSACKEDALDRKVVSQISPNGVKFQHLEIRDEGDTDVSIVIAWPTDWPYTQGRNQAVPHIAADVLLAGGTATREPREILEFFDENNAEGSIIVYPDHVVGELFFTDQNREEVISVTTELLSSPQFPENWLERTKASYLDHKAQTDEVVINRMWAAGRYAILGNSSLRAYLDVGSAADIEEIDSTLLREWHADTFVQTGVTIAVVGAITAERSGAFIDQLLAGLPVGAAKSATQSETNYAPRTILLHIPEAEKTAIGLIGALPATTDGQDISDILAMNYFGSSGSGPLFEAVRTNLRASYGIGSGVTNFNRLNRVMFIGGEVDEALLPEVRDAILDTYEVFRTTGNFPDFDDQRKKLASFLSEDMEYFDVASFGILQADLDNHDPAIILNIEDHVLEFSLATVQQRLSETYPGSGQLVVIAVSPNANALPGACIITEIRDAVDC